MKKTIANYTTQPDESFPLDCETMQYIADNAALLEVLGNIAGDRVILQGCNVISTATRERAPGYIYLRTKDYPAGEVLHFSGGSEMNGFYLKKEVVSINAAGNEYPEAYVRRSLEPGVGEENFRWEDFSVVLSNRKLDETLQEVQRQVRALESVPVGTVLIWPGNAVPSSYLWCQGQELKKADYPALFSVVTTIYGGSGDTFRLPDMRGRFVAGKGAGDYASLNNRGGLDKVTLTAAQSGLPEHMHDYIVNTYSAPQASDGADRLCRGKGDKFTYRLSTDMAASKNAEQAHENRPPYIVMNYIIKVK